MPHKSRAVSKGLNIQLSEFKISKWITNFIKQNGLSLRCRITVSQKLPETYNEKLLDFWWYVEDLRKSRPGSICRAGEQSLKREGIRLASRQPAMSTTILR